MLPVLINPLGRILGAPLAAAGPDPATPDSSANNSDFLVGDTAGPPGADAASAPGIENPTTDDVGSAFGARPLGAVDEEPAGRRREAQDLGGCLAVVSAGVGGAVEVKAGAVIAVSSVSVSVAGAGAGSPSDFLRSGDVEEAGASETEVLVDNGDPGTTGVSGAVEHAGVVVVSVAVAETGSGSGDIFSSTTGNWGEGGGEGDGVRNSIALEIIFCGGRARGEIMIPGACVGSRGLLDQIAQSSFGAGVAGSEGRGEEG